MAIPRRATDHNNQLLTDGAYRYTYDAEGNRQLRFVWNDANQNQQVEDMSGATLPSTPGTTETG